MRKATFVLSALALASLSSVANAQGVSGFKVDRFNPSERGSEWFALDTLDMRGEVRPAFGVVGEWASKPLELTAPNGTKTDIVDSQMFLHVGGSLVLLDRFRLGLNVPI